ncbi:hypothetical protein [Planctobacterium marinum]|uniref:Uncharacterized protein n=1 Tax=Planctobacterium marinum TaxID=1631968 RepID=A0AA48KS39_9ALTE|nr:hypothetical protein MACH26_16000 [Planctobacterium marinum]
MSTVKNVEKAGRQFWLAGLGACLLGKEYAVKKMDELLEGTNSLVNGVLAKGATIEGELKTKLQSGFPQDEKILELREKLGLNKESKQDKIARLAAKVDALTEIVATLTVKTEETKATTSAPSKTQEAAAPAPKPAAKRTTTRKPRAASSKTTSSAAAPKPAARRTTTRKTTTQTKQSKTDSE